MIPSFSIKEVILLKICLLLVIHSKIKKTIIYKLASTEKEKDTNIQKIFRNHMFEIVSRILVDILFDYIDFILIDF